MWWLWVNLNLRHDLSSVSGRLLIPGLLLVWDDSPSCTSSRFPFLSYVFIWENFILTFYIVIIDKTIDFEGIFFAYAVIHGSENTVSLILGCIHLMRFITVLFVLKQRQNLIPKVTWVITYSCWSNVVVFSKI